MLDDVKKDKQRIHELEEQLAREQQKVKFVNHLIGKDIGYKIDCLAKVIEIIDGENTTGDIYEWLVDNGYLTTGNIPTSKSINNSFMKLDVQIYQKAEFFDVIKTPLITADGFIFFVNEYLGGDD